jgi:alkaline phosphatase D
MLDERMSGRTKQPSEENASLESNTMLGKNQYDWLVNEMNQSTAAWNILGNQVLFSSITIPPDVAGIKKSMDTWQGYLKERNQLFDEFHKISLAKYQANNLIVLTGDIHSSLALTLEHKNKPLGVEWVAPSVTSANYNERYSSCKTKSVERKLRNKALNPALDFVNLRHHGFVLVELTPSHAKSTWFKVKVTKPGKTKSKKIHTESIQKIITPNG